MPGKAVAVVVCPSLTPCIMPGSPGLAQPCSTPGAGRHLPSIDGAPGPVARGGIHLAAGFFEKLNAIAPGWIWRAHSLYRDIRRRGLIQSSGVVGYPGHL